MTGAGEPVLLNFQPIHIQMLQGFVFCLGRTGQKEKSVAGENSAWKLVRRNKNSEWQKAGREEEKLQ